MAETGPVDDGVKVTVTVPVAPAANARLEGETANWASSGTMLPTDNVALPVLVMPSSCWPDDPTATAPRESEAEDTEIAGDPEAVPVPDSERV